MKFEISNPLTLNITSGNIWIRIAMESLSIFKKINLNILNYLEQIFIPPKGSRKQMSTVVCTTSRIIFSN